MQTSFSESPFEAARQGDSPWQEGEQRAPRLGGQRLSPGAAASEFLQEYARERPEVVAMWAFGLGFVLGWKLKPW